MSQTFTKRTQMPVSAAELYAWHERPGAFERLNPVFDPVEVEARQGGLEVGAFTKIKMKIGPVTQGWTAVHTACEPGKMFRDEQQGGPFKTWVHTHRFIDEPGGTSILDDTIDYELPVGALGELFGGGFATSQLNRVFAYRHAITHADLERHAQFAGKPRLRIAVTGASGMVASALIPFLTTAGHEVVRVRRKGNEINAEDLDGADVVVHLAGAGVADERWTDERKAMLVSSRVAFTDQLVRLMRSAKRPPKVLISGSAIGVYGDRGDDVLDDSAAVGERGPKKTAFLAGLCRDWEEAALKAEADGVRVVTLRIGLVQSASGGALAKLLTPFKAGVGGPVGTGKQWQSWISLEDLIGVIHFVTMTPGVTGALNAVGPAPVTSAEYAKVLGHVLSRPAVAPLPAFALRALFGEMADGAILASQRVLPTKLQALGFRFLHETLESALRLTLGK